MGYYKDIVSQYPVQSKEEEQDMIKKYIERNDIEGLKERLVLHNVGIIMIVARKFHYLRFYDEDELMSYGLDGLRSAAEKFNPKLNFRFSSYAEKAIRTSLFRSIPLKRNKIDERSTSMDSSVYSEDDECSFGDYVEMKIPEEYRTGKTPRDTSFKSDFIDFFLNICKPRMSERKYNMFYDRFVLDRPFEEIERKYKVSHTIVSDSLKKARKAFISGVKPFLGLKEPSWDDFKKSYEVTKCRIRNGKMEEYVETIDTGYDWKSYQRAWKNYRDAVPEKLKEFIKDNVFKKDR